MATRMSNVKRSTPNVTMLFAALTVCFAGPVLAQDESQSSRRESEAIKQVEESGGRVYRISAADASREISFYLSSKPIGDEQLTGLSAINEVIWLNLAGTAITDDGLKHLAGLPLQKLHLERTQIGDEGLKHLKSFKDLTYLNIYDTKVTDAGLEHLKELKQLKKLFVWKSGVTDVGMAKLNESLPELMIVGELKLEPVVIEEPKKEEPAKEKPKTEGDKKADTSAGESPKADDKKADDKKPETKKSDADKSESGK